MTLDCIVDAQDTIELCDIGRISMEIDEGVVTLGKAVNLVSKFTLAPVIDASTLPPLAVIATSARFITPRVSAHR